MPQALDLARQALLKAEMRFGASDTNVAKVLDVLASVLASATIVRPQEALVHATRSLSIKESVYGAGDPAVADALSLLSVINLSLRKIAEARVTLERALRIYEEAHATDKWSYPSAIHDLAYTYQHEGDYEKAANLYNKALDVYRRVLKPNDPALAYSLTMLAVTYWSLGWYSEAEPLLNEALANWERNYGPESVRSAICLGNLAQHYQLQGKLSQAEALQRRSVEIARKRLSAEDPMLGRGLLGLGNVLVECGHYSAAIDTLSRAMTILRRLEEPQSRIAMAMRKIGQCYLAQRKFNQAESLFVGALAFSDSLRGGGRGLNTELWLELSRTYMCTGKFGAADSILKKTLTDLEGRLSPDNPAIAEVLDAYCEYYRRVRCLPEAFEVSQRAIAIRTKNFVLNARVMSEQDAHSYSSFLRHSVDGYLSTLLDARSPDPISVRRAAEIVLSTKGLATEQALLRRRNLVRETDSLTLELAEQYRSARFHLSTRYIEGPQRKSDAEYQREVDSLEKLVNDLEALLARRSASFAETERSQDLGIDAIASHLPANAGLVEFLLVNSARFDPDTVVPRYIALIIDKTGRADLVDIGTADRIDKTIKRYRNHLTAVAQQRRWLETRESAEYGRIARELYNLIWRQVDSVLKERGTIFIAPDGGLNLISFAGLIDPAGKYIIEKHALHYLSAARDVMSGDVPTVAGSGLIAFGDPDFDASATDRLSSGPTVAMSTDPGGSYQVRNIRSGCEQLSTLTVSRLFNTKAEIGAVVGYWREGNPLEPVVSLLGSMASEEFFKRGATGKRVIHLATHGYFLQAGCLPEGQAPSGIGESPLLRSGLLLAGANLHGQGAREIGIEDGILTALEVSAMDLRGTDLVVLSACETGLGSVRQGEGVYGLRRAFQMAGAKTVVSSLWQVPDMESMKFMKSLYSMNSQTYPELMQKVTLKRITEARQRGRPTHPFTWGAFVVTGEWKDRSQGSAK